REGSASGAASAKQQAAAGDPTVNPDATNAPGSAKAPASGTAPQLQFANEPPDVGNSIGRLATPSPTPAVEKKPRATPPALSRVVGNRDFVITVGCYEKGVLLTPGSATFLWNTQTDPKQTDETLVRAVAELVSRRQATVRNGEAPFRPVLRFEVREQGRR